MQKVAKLHYQNEESIIKINELFDNGFTIKEKIVEDHREECKSITYLLEK